MDGKDEVLNYTSFQIASRAHHGQKTAESAQRGMAKNMVSESQE